MQSLLMPDLYAQHCAQLSAMIRQHEINVIAEAQVEKVDLVNVRYPHAEPTREFTALITARARDYYVDDRTQQFLRGDEASARFQEFWTFQRQEGKWLLREIEQTRESDKLKEENFFEPFTDEGRQQVYAETASAGGPSGPWLDNETAIKATRIERLLNFLVLTDKLWDRSAMIQRARQVFFEVMSAFEAGDPARIPANAVFPAVAATINNAIQQARTEGQTVEYRNLCVRKVELMLVRNYADNTRDEFMARISAHAQYLERKQATIVRQDEDVSPFVEYFVFGRLDGQWKLKEILPEAQGQSQAGQENVDEESSADQLQWYYQHTRAN
jgi:predicted lipid-binding transport protein (Tim44 family)